MPGHSFTVEGYVYKPRVYKDGPYHAIERTHHADSFGFDAHFNVEMEDYTFEIGGSWTSNIAASRGMKDAIENFGLEGIYIDSKIDAIAAYMSGTCRNFYFTTEYMQSVEPLRHAYINGIGLPDVDGHFAHPNLWTVEVGAGIEEYLALPMPVELMFRYAGSTEAQPIYEIPRSRWAMGLNTGIYDYATWSLAYAYNDYDEEWDELYGEAHGRTNRHLFFTQIAVKF